ncbi:MAG: Ig-like domain-containing protein [Saprospiraceae bacterium]|nr:Ig-like domain-containing protein [Saprospiraceae bacterium]
MERKDILSFLKLNLLRLRYFHFLIVLCLSVQVFGQLNLDFNSEALTEPLWGGNISDFKINTAGQLQLSAVTAGESYIYTKYKAPEDSIQVDIYLKLQFSPSNDNFSKIYLFTDNSVESQANGYYMRVGENGSNDALQFWKLTNGTAALLGSGTLGAMSADPADARVRMKIYRDGYWNISVDYSGSNLFNEDLEFYDPGFIFPDSLYFGIYSKYTITRIDKFFYDDIFIKTIEKDSFPPDLLKVDVKNETTLELTFSEPLDESSAKNMLNYTVDNGIGNPDLLTFSNTNPNNITLIFNTKNILSGKKYTITVSGVKDRASNVKVSKKEFFLVVAPQKGDLILTEILTDPYVGGEDFIEVYNRSDKFLKLDGLVVRNRQKNESKTILTDMILLPGEFVAISKNTDFLKQTYSPPVSANFISATLPSLNIDAANITLITISDNLEIVVDSFDYVDAMHFELIDETKGVSLERINLNAGSNDANNWHSASQGVNFATPGYKNSNILTGQPVSSLGFALDKKVFSPNGDGFEDFVLLQYKIEKEGFLVSIKIFDSEGFPVLDLVDNFLLGTEGAIKWDGIDGEGNKIRMGLYLIYARLFHSDGDIREYKNVVVVADNF